MPLHVCRNASISIHTQYHAHTIINSHTHSLIITIRVERVKERKTILKYHIQTSNYIHYIRAPVDIFDKISKNYLFLHNHTTK